MGLAVHPNLAIPAASGLNRLRFRRLVFFCGGRGGWGCSRVRSSSWGGEAAAGVGVVAAVALVFFECFFAGEAEASGLGLGVGSAARTVGAATNAVMITIRIMRERISRSLRLDGWIWQEYRLGWVKFARLANAGRERRMLDAIKPRTSTATPTVLRSSARHFKEER
jgi:hypothetical protein